MAFCTRSAGRCLEPHGRGNPRLPPEHNAGATDNRRARAQLLRPVEEIEPMAIDMTPEQREVGRENYRRAVQGLGLDRRDFMKGAAATAGAAAVVGAAGYY